MNVFKSSSSSLNANHATERQNILSALLECVKICQTKFGGRAELATETDGQVSALCQCLENVLSHGLRSKIVKNSSAFPSGRKVTFWDYVQLFLTRHELDRYLCLKNISSDLGRGRAWLRSSLNERSLERYLNSLLGDPRGATSFYHEWALILDQDLNSVLPNTAAGLSSILFAINIDEPKLNDVPANNQKCPTTPQQTEPILSVSTPNSAKTPHHRKNNVVSFEPEPVIEPEIATEVFYIKDNDAERGSRLLGVGGSPPSSNDESFQEFESGTSGVHDEVETLTPITDKQTVGELMLITANDDINTEKTNSSTSTAEEVEDVQVDNILATLKNSLGLPLDQIEILVAYLEQFRDTLSHYKGKLKVLKAKHRAEISKSDAKVATLMRENDVLKHQLRKYVGAVQMLNKDGAAHEALAFLEASQTEREESLKYQEQLVQVAQMHGELMEFNDRLQRQLAIREEALVRLERELTDLRGPLPEDEGPFPDALVNIWIPSAFLSSGSGSGVHHLYQVYIRIRDTEWNVYRRYSQFYALHKALKRSYAQIAALDFPPKKTIGNKDAKFVEDRRQKLQKYLRQAVDVVVRNRTDLSDPVSLTTILPFFSENCVGGDFENKLRRDGRKSRKNPVDPSQYNGL